MLLQQLVTFARVVELGSFTRAGELLNLSQPAVTRQVAALEREFDVSLIERSGRRIAVTAAGQVVYTHARRIAALVERARVDVYSVTHPERGLVSVAAVTTVGLFTLPVLLAEFRERYPLVRIQVWSGRTDGVLDRLLEGNADVGLLSAPIAHPRLDCTPLFDDPIVLVAAPSVARALPDPLPLEQLAEVDMILYQSPSRFRTLVEASLEQAGAYPHVAMEFDSHEAVRAAALAGYGVGVVPLEAVQEEIAAGALVRLQVAGLPEIKRTTCLVQRRGATPLPAVENFVRLTLARYGRHEGGGPPAVAGQRGADL
jgi:DNA-binding transcriptional LysR family regulator